MSVQNEPDPRQWPEAVRWLTRADDDLRIIHLALNVVDPPLFADAASELAPSAQDIAAVLGKLHELRRRIETLRPSGTE